MGTRHEVKTRLGKMKALKSENKELIRIIQFEQETRR